MTEYDFSPAAIAAHHEKLAGIAQWTQSVPTKPQQLANPFLPRPRPADETDFYRSHSSPRDRSKRKKDKKRSSRSHGPSRARGYETEDYSDSSSDDGGPDRPPTPPVSAPVYPGGGGYYTSPWPQQQQVYPAKTNVLVPTWNGMTWVYASPQAASPPAQYPPNAYDNRGRDKHRDSGRHHSSSRHPRPKPSRRNSQSVPPVSYTSPGGYTIIYPGVQQPQPQPQSQSTSANTTPSPASAWTSPLPVSPGMYGTPTPAAVGSGGGGYFSPQYTSPNQRTPQQTFYPPPTHVQPSCSRSPRAESNGERIFGRLVRLSTGLWVRGQLFGRCARGLSRDGIRWGSGAVSVWTTAAGYRRRGTAEEGRGKWGCEHEEREEWKESIPEADWGDVR
ncbi:hypothetical protein DFP72DRAFT_559465 [Ephemerocybe angulata]|uniref:Uncharacterized protein n=1 Tax=Ephemerocybe angulata TaxID=980116 RepID=A0A8H6IBI4_9AGAR|nr:hypothetical protein DFP72DRAFT_559465 [Tulosesus angulatus]